MRPTTIASPALDIQEKKSVSPLLPICHSTTQAHIEIVISKDGNFRRANVVFDKNDMTPLFHVLKVLQAGLEANLKTIRFATNFNMWRVTL